MITSPLQGRHAITTYLKATLPGVLVDVTTATGVELTPPVTWAPITNAVIVPEEQLPAVYVIADALNVLREDWDGETTCDMPARVLVVVAGRDRQESQDRATAYADAIRYCLTTDRSAGGVMDGMAWRAQSPAGTDASDGQYRAHADVSVTYRVTVPNELPVTPVLVAAPIALSINRLEL